MAFGAPTPEDGAARRLMTGGAGGICQMDDNYLDARSRVSPAWRRRTSRAGGHRTKPAGDVRAAIIILALMGENNPPHRKSMEHAAKFAILDSSRLLQALQSVRTIEVSLWYGAVHRKKTKVGAASS